MNGESVLIPNAKDPRDTITVTLDGSAWLAAGETWAAIVSTTITAVRNADAAASSMLVTAAINSQAVTISGNTMAIGAGVLVNLIGGLSGVEYQIACTCRKNTGEVRTLKALLMVSAQ